MRAVCLALTLLWCSTSLAEPLAPKIIPLGQKLKVKNQTYKCYSFEEYKKLLDFDNELETARGKLSLSATQISIISNQKTLIQKTNLRLELDLKKALEEVDVMTEKWKAENKARHEAEADKHFWSSIGAIGGSAALLVAILTMTFSG